MISDEQKCKACYDFVMLEVEFLVLTFTINLDHYKNIQVFIKLLK